MGGAGMIVLATTGETVLAVVLGVIAVGGALVMLGASLGQFALIVSAILGYSFLKPRRWYRIVRDVGHTYDSDGLRVHRHPEHGDYYLRALDVLAPIRHTVGTSWFSPDPKWCVALSGRTRELYVTRRSRASRRAPRWARSE